MHHLKIAFKQLARLHSIPYWVFLGLFVVSTVVCISALRHNNETMIKLRGELYIADKDNGDTNKALNNLRDYVYSHMNTNLSSGGNTIKPPIQLQYTYQRLQAASSDPIPPALYEYDFVSPSWSPDLAGWSLLLSILFFTAFIISYLRERLTRRDLDLAES